MKKEKLKAGLHLLAALISVYHSFSLFYQGAGEYSFFYLIAGIFFIAVAGTSKDVAKGFLFNGGMFLFIEGLLIFLASRNYFLHNHTLRGYILVGLSVVYLFMAITCIRLKNKKNGMSSDTGEQEKKYKSL